MEKYRKDRELSDFEKIKDFLIELGFICQSQSSSQNLIYSKKGDVVIIKNNNK